MCNTGIPNGDLKEGRKTYDARLLPFFEGPVYLYFDSNTPNERGNTSLARLLIAALSKF